jgi:hypothetical protein
MDPGKRVVHAGDINDVGRVVAAAFAARDRLPDGSMLAVCGGIYSWNDFVATFRSLGQEVECTRVPADTYDQSYPGAAEVRQMFQYWEELTYFGPQWEAHVAAARALVPGGFASFADWAATHLRNQR